MRCGRAALTFVWLPLERQVRVEGTVSRLSADESAAFARALRHALRCLHFGLGEPDFNLVIRSAALENGPMSVFRPQIYFRWYCMIIPRLGVDLFARVAQALTGIASGRRSFSHGRAHLALGVARRGAGAQNLRQQEGTTTRVVYIIPQKSSLVQGQFDEPPFLQVGWTHRESQYQLVAPITKSQRDKLYDDHRRNGPVSGEDFNAKLEECCAQTKSRPFLVYKLQLDKVRDRF